jgi:HD-GYP domain-containing protein (c-di-GMP phosphodiesterase class II)
LDGSGPEKLKGENIPLSAKIVRVADVFERMINGRNGKKYTIKEALEYIKKNKDKLFDSEVVNALERYIYKNY